MRRDILLSGLLVLVLVVRSGWTYKYYESNIPNGAQVPDPCGGQSGWSGVGHQNKQGGGARNPFGVDFAATNHVWTSELCRKDSDGDGDTNGEELGDPNCIWTPGQTPARGAASHPGVCEPLGSPTCTSSNSWLSCRRAIFSCPQLQQADVKSFDVRMPRNNVPAKETTYMCVTVDLPADEDYHVIGLEPKIDNAMVLHHAIVYGCPEAKIRGAARDKAEQCGMAGSKCNEYIAGWSLGSPGHCFNPDVGFHVGKNSVRTVKMTLHYTNVQKRSDLWDSTAMRIYYTAKRRKFDSGTLNIGTNDIIIPPGVPSFDINGTCPSQCTSRWSGPVKVIDGFLHAHYLGKDLEVYHKSNGVTKSIMRDSSYQYDNPQFSALPTPLEILPGDELTLRCSYQSKDRKTVTRFGQGTFDEMCLAFLTYYPRLPDRPLPSCVQRRGRVSCPTAATSKCNLDKTQIQPALSRVVSACKIPCSPSCISAVSVVQSHPCSKDAVLNKAAKQVPNFLSVYNKMKDCGSTTSPTIRPTGPTVRPTSATSSRSPQCSANYYLKTSQGRQILQRVPRVCSTCTSSCVRLLRGVLRSTCMQQPIKSKLRNELLATKDADAQEFFKALDTAVISCLKPNVG